MATLSARFVLLTAAPLALIGLSGCKPHAAEPNNVVAAPVVDGNFDDANFVVPDDEGSGDENANTPDAADNGASPAAHTTAAHGGHAAGTRR